MKHKIQNILNLLYNERGFDFTGCRHTMLERRIQKRVYHLKQLDFQEYYNYLHQHPEEFDNLVDVLTINVSSFFRNPLMFEYFSTKILPGFIADKLKKNDNSLRIWSAGCSHGEEPYSMAIIINELFEREQISLDLNIFATDIDKRAIKFALVGKYDSDSIKEIKLDIFEKYFSIEHDFHLISPEIKKMVHLTFHDLLDKNHFVPPESIFGGFDIVLCRNVLIYFNLDHQKIIFNKLYRSLNKNGYLILGEAEVPDQEFKYKFRRENKCCKIYRKIG